MAKTAKVTVICLTFNHEHYIGRAIEGILRQVRDFDIRLIIHDDCSNDGTLKVVNAYYRQYPDIIDVISQTENKFSQGIDILKNYICDKIDSEYVALCEGDDCWIDDNKLQKQVEFLDRNKDYSICFHQACVYIDQDFSKVSPSNEWVKKQGVLNLELLLKRNFIPTCSVMYRWRRNIKQLIPDFAMPGDWYLHLLHAEVGIIGFIPLPMSQYNRHSNGLWTGADKSIVWILKYSKLRLNFYKKIECHFHYVYNEELEFYKKAVEFEEGGLIKRKVLNDILVYIIILMKGNSEERKRAIGGLKFYLMLMFRRGIV